MLEQVIPSEFTLIFQIIDTPFLMMTYNIYSKSFRTNLELYLTRQYRTIKS